MTYWAGVCSGMGTGEGEQSWSGEGTTNASSSGLSFPSIPSYLRLFWTLMTNKGQGYADASAAH